MSENKVVQTTGLIAWIDKRFPLSSTWKAHLSEYYVPKNLNFWYLFGSLALLVLVIQTITGIFLVMHYKPDAAQAFASVEYIMREVPYGWIIRYMHSTGASMFFVVVYLHMFRGLLYGSYRKPRELVWIFGVAIFLCLMAQAFFGYLLPWGQMSYWGAQVMVNLFSAIPIIGEPLSIWIRGDFVVSDATLNRFFAFHVIAIPLVIIALVVAHITALHEVGSNNPDGIEIKDHLNEQGKPVDGVPFYPYYTAHDLLGAIGFLMVFAAIVFFAPTMGGYFLEANNFMPANVLQTPAHIAPVWYFTPFYSMLRATTDELTWALAALALVFAFVLLKILKGKFKIIIPLLLILMAFGLRVLDAKFWGVVIMASTVLIFAFLPWLDQSPVRSIRYRPFFHKVLLGIFVIDFVTLGYIGTQVPNPVLNLIAQVGTIIYLSFFLFMPFWSRAGECKPLPERLNFEPYA